VQRCCRRKILENPDCYDRREKQAVSYPMLLIHSFVSMQLGDLALRWTRRQVCYAKAAKGRDPR